MEPGTPPKDLYDSPPRYKWPMEEDYPDFWNDFDPEPKTNRTDIVDLLGEIKRNYFTGELTDEDRRLNAIYFDCKKWVADKEKRRPRGGAILAHLLEYFAENYGKHKEEMTCLRYGQFPNFKFDIENIPNRLQKRWTSPGCNGDQMEIVYPDDGLFSKGCVFYVLGHYEYFYCLFTDGMYFLTDDTYHYGVKKGKSQMAQLFFLRDDLEYGEDSDD